MLASVDAATCVHWLRTTNITKLKVVIVSNKQNSLSQWIHPTRTEHVLFSIVELAATTICARDCFASEPRWSAEQTRDLIYGCNVGSAALDQAEAVITKQTKTVCVCRPPNSSSLARWDDA